MNTNFQPLIQQYKADKESVYNTWFINNEDRLKAFRSIRRGIIQVIEDIKCKRFPNDFKGSSLEFVLSVITEKKQVFEGASHPFYWKPKLLIPDIYENEGNKQAFGQFLECCLNAKSEDQIIKEIIKLDACKIKGLGPAVASILYFLHPTIVPPFNTAIINGFNFLFKDKKKLRSWSEYLKLREVLVNTNNQHRAELSSDLGAIAGLLFEVGMKKSASILTCRKKQVRRNGRSQNGDQDAKKVFIKLYGRYKGRLGHTCPIRMRKKKEPRYTGKDKGTNTLRLRRFCCKEGE